jgi:hypothetical protein
MASVLDEELPSALELEEYLQNGVLLCKLAMKLLPDEPMWKKVYDLDQSKFKVRTCTCTQYYYIIRDGRPAHTCVQ